MDARTVFFRELAADDQPLLTRAEEQALGRRIEQGDATALDELILRNRRLVVSMARAAYARSRGEIPFEDLIQEGMVGLVIAARRYDWRKGNRFSTYATWWIRQAIGRAQLMQARLIRPPVYIAERVARVHQAQADLMQVLHRQPTVEELAEALHMPVAAVIDALRADRPVLSLEQPLVRDEDLTIADQVGGLCHLLDSVERRLDAQRVHRALEQLPPMQRQILVWRYGLDGSPPATLREISARLGRRISYERVRQLEALAMKRLRTLARRGAV